MNILDATSKFFSAKKSKPAAGDIADLQVAVRARLAEIEARQSVIVKRGRDQVNQTGTAADIDKLDAEERSLKSEELALRARQTRLHQEAKTARADAAIRDASKTRARLSDAVGTIESMQHQLDDAQKNLQSQLNALAGSKQVAGDVPALDIAPELAERIARVVHGNDNLRTTASDRQRLVQQLAPRRGNVPAPKADSAYEHAGVVA